MIAASSSTVRDADISDGALSIENLDLHPWWGVTLFSQFEHMEKNVLVWVKGCRRSALGEKAVKRKGRALEKGRGELTHSHQSES